MKKMKPVELERGIHQLAKQNDDIDVVWIYGSMADGTATKTSDIDIAIAFCSFPHDQLERLARPDMLASEWMKNLCQFNRKISIVDINKIPIPLAWEVVNSNYVIYEQKNNRRFIEEKRIFSRMELDIAWHRKQYG